jgi:hypothetical protein
MNDSHTRSNALFVELADQLDAIAPRVEALLPKLVDINKSIQSAAAGLDAAADRHRTTYTAIQAQAMKGIGEFAARRTQQAALKSAAEYDVILRATVQDLLNTTLIPALRAFNQKIDSASGRTPISIWSTWLPVLASAAVASALTVAGVAALRWL